MSHSKNGNLLGKAAVTQLHELRAELREIQEREAERKVTQETMEVCQKIADILGTRAYRRWWKAAPDNGFLKYAKAKLAELTTPIT
jgi:hypothetical protein